MMIMEMLPILPIIKDTLIKMQLEEIVMEILLIIIDIVASYSIFSLNRITLNNKNGIIYYIIKNNFILKL